MKFTQLLLVICFFLGKPASAQSLQEIFKKGTFAYEERDYSSFLMYMQQADSIRPNHPTILYRLAAGFALTHQNDLSIHALRRALWMNAGLPFVQNEDFSGLKGEARFDMLVKEIETLNKEIRGGTTLFELADKSIHPEAIAYSEQHQTFFVSSIRQSKILVLSEDGRIVNTIKRPGFMSIMGLKVDEAKDQLWICSTPATEMKDYQEGLKAEVLCMDLNTYEIVSRHQAPQLGDWLGDLAISAKGDVYVSNSSAQNPSIYQVNRQSDTLEVLLEFTELASIQGVTLSPDDATLFFSDYRHGLFQYNLELQEYASLQSTVIHPLKGIDGLYYHENALIAIHNGLRPFRIVRYELDLTFSRIENYQFIEKALPEMNEPTLGFLRGSEFYYVANSPWAAYSNEKELNLEQVGNPIFRKVLLK